MAAKDCVNGVFTGKKVDKPIKNYVQNGDVEI
jgi:hypothetical protein